MTTSSAPGRVNLIGEHTDYNDGFVLPTIIPQRTHVELIRQSEDVVDVCSREIGVRSTYRLGEETATNTWLDYVQGVTAMLRAAGHVVGGVELRITSDVPLGSGLSSSASLELALLRAFREEYALDIDDLALALLGQRVETEFVGVPVGAMDQLAASMGRPGEALLIDTRSLGIWHIALPPADLIVIASGVRHDHSTGSYRVRRAECQRAAAILGVHSLRDAVNVTIRLPAPLDRRVRHVVTENARVLATVEAIATGDLVAIGTMFRASHASMRDDYEVSVPAIDTLVRIADDDPEVYGARLTGGGFGGSIVALAVLGHGSQAAERVADKYRDATGHQPSILVAGDPR